MSQTSKVGHELRVFNMQIALPSWYGRTPTVNRERNVWFLATMRQVESGCVGGDCAGGHVHGAK